MTINGTGRLRHQFWGTYSATLGIQFATADDAKDACEALNRATPDVWKQSTDAIVAFDVSSETLDAIKSSLEANGLAMVKCTRRGCRSQHAIDDLAHSVDHGSPFTVAIPRPVAREQASLF